jgi:intergrase/recombinase
VPQRPAPRIVFDRGKPKVKLKGKPTAKSMRNHRDGSRHVYVLDLFSGTCTSAALYALRRHPHARVVCVDRDHTLAWVRRSKRIPERYLERLLIINDDIRRLNKDKIMEARPSTVADGAVARLRTRARIAELPIVFTRGPGLL